MVLHGIEWYCMVLCGWIDRGYSCLTECTSGCRGLRSFETAFFGVVFALFGRSVLPVKEVKGCVWSFVAILESLCNRSTGQGEKGVAPLRSSSIISPHLVEVLCWDFSEDCRLRCDCNDCKVLGLRILQFFDLSTSSCAKMRFYFLHFLQGKNAQNRPQN